MNGNGRNTCLRPRSEAGPFKLCSPAADQGSYEDPWITPISILQNALP
jgi:hypothetical protein